MYIVGFNGPPESGKDTLAEMVAEHMDQQGVKLPVRFESLSLPLRHIAFSMVGRQYARQGLTQGLINAEYADFKREWFPNLNRDGRHLMIDASESFLKPTYGIDVMARLLLERNAGFQGVLLIRDCGFACEVEPLAQHIGLSNLCMVQIERAGTNFLNDSREWVFHPLGRNIRVTNNGTLDDLRTEAGCIYGRLVNQFGWKL